jgi:carboxyl-terminal processing protease
MDYNEFDEYERYEKRSRRWGNVLRVVVGMLVGAMLTMGIVYFSLNVFRKRIIEEVQKQYTVSEEGEQSLSEIETKLENLQGYIDQYYLFDEDYEAVADSVYKGLVNGLGDKYSAYYTAEEYASLMESTSGSYCGIGATVQKDPDTGYIRVVSMFEGSGALEQGVEPDDLITRIAGEDTADMDISTAAAKMKGEENTTVEVEIYRTSTGETLNFTITRRQIDIDTVAGEMLDDQIGYIVISEFDGVTAKQFESILNDLMDQGMKGLVVDLRDNPGGLLTSVNDILDLLLPEGTIVYTEDKYGSRETYTSDASWNDVPMAVLVNGNSASASEIFAGAVKDYERATLVGTQTFGKGIVQTIRQLSDGSAIKLTIARYYTPNGVCIHGEGITPDIVLEYDSEAVEGLETITWEDDNQLMAAYEAVLEKIGQ